MKTLNPENLNSKSLRIASVFIHPLVISISYHIVWMCCLSVGEPGVWREHVSPCPKNLLEPSNK